MNQNKEPNHMLTVLQFVPDHLHAAARRFHEDDDGMALAEGMAIAVFAILVAVVVFDQLGLLGLDIVDRIRTEILG